MEITNEVSALQQAFDRMKAQYDGERVINSNLRSSIESVREYLLSNSDDLGDHATEIAELLGIELTRTATVTVTVVHTIELTDLPASADAYSVIRDIEYNMSFDSDGNINEGTVDSSVWEITSNEVDFE